MSNYNYDDETMNQIRKFVNVDEMNEGVKRATINMLCSLYNRITDTLMDDLVDKHHELMFI